MIALLALAAALAARFAPPRDVAIGYDIVETRPIRGGQARITLHQTLRFAAESEGYVATVVATGHAVDAPEPYRTLIDAPFAPFEGVPSRVRLDAAGRITGVIDAARTWDAVRAAENGLLARIDAEAAIPPQAKAAARASITAIDQTPPAQRDARLADAVSALLAPPLPALAVGESRAFTAALRSPVGELPSAGTVTLASAAAGVLTYRVDTRSTAKAADAAATALLATLGPAASPEERARITATIKVLRATVYVQHGDLVIDAATGLLVRAHTERGTLDADGASRVVETSDTVRAP